MSSNYYGPTGSSEVTGYRIPPVEHRLRIDFAIGGRDTGLERALNTLEDEGRRDVYTGTKNAYERAVSMLDHPRDPVEWGIYTIVKDDNQAQRINRDYQTIPHDDLDSVADLTHFDVHPPEEVVVLRSPDAVSSSKGDSFYAWAPSDEEVSICLCPAKVWQRDSNILCKHEIAALLAMDEGSFNVETSTLDKAKKTLVSQHAYSRFDPSPPA
jgi:hypothetical protein